MRDKKFHKGRGSRSGGRRDRDGRPDGQRGGRSRSPQRQSFDSGNQRERIAVESGSLVLIDQFMLANPQFLRKYSDIIDAGPEAKSDLVQKFGGRVVEVHPGTYRIERDPFRYTLVVHPEGQNPEHKTLAERATTTLGHVFVDTRCLAMVDRELLDDSGLLEKYQQLWFSGQDKACRDLLRDNGGAVRYGFSRNSDELAIYSVPGEDIVCLWPDVVEKGEASMEQDQAG